MSDKVYEVIHKGRVRSRLEGAASKVNRYIAAYFGDKIPLYCVAEYPRSGGTWLSSMMADYLRCAKPGLSVLPSACRAVMHAHWPYHPKLKRTVYLVRDGRDVLVSLYFYSQRLYKMRAGGGHGNKKSRERLEYIYGDAGGEPNTQRSMEKYLRAEFENPTVVRAMNWAQHIRSWHGTDGKPHILYLRYEELLSDPVNSLRRAVEHVSPITADERLLKRSVDHFNMEAMTGRAPGESDDGAFIRKGISGDWRNHFDRELAREFDKLAGDELLLLGFEKDRTWVDECPETISTEKGELP